MLFVEEGRKMTFYETNRELYRKADAATRAASRAHWTKCHRENIASGRRDMIIFSAQILAGYDLIEADEAEQGRRTA
jgi:hypothetical protein